MNQSLGQWNREIWVGQSVGIPELLIGEALDLGSTRMAEGWCVTPLVSEGGCPPSSAGGITGSRTHGRCFIGANAQRCF